MTNRDFRDLFFALNVAEVRYLIVGAYAVTFHSRPRYTKDLDLWIDPDPANAKRAWRALAAFGAPMKDVQPTDLADPEKILILGMAPNRIDILTSLDGLTFSEAWERRAPGRYADCAVTYLSKSDLIKNKKLAGRPQDIEDVRVLERRTPAESERE